MERSNSALLSGVITKRGIKVMSKINLLAYVKSGYSVLYILTAEEARAEKEVVEIAKSLKRNLRIWSCTEGFINPAEKNPVGDQMTDPVEALNAIKADAEEGKIFIFRDLTPFMGQSPFVARMIRDVAKDFKQCRKTLVLISPENKIPAGLDRDVTMIEFALPDITDIEGIFDGLYAINKKGMGEVSPEERDRICQAALGLTTTEAENAMSKSIVEKVAAGNDKQFSAYVMEAKAEAVSKSGILEYFPTQASLADVGGLENLKSWLKVRSKAFSKKAREFGLPMPRGMMLAGLPGTGKSLSAKVCASILGVPLIRFDIGKVFGGMVGDSERNMRTAIQTAEAVGNCVLWIDEMEKGFAGVSGSGSGDSGVGKRIFGQFITWMVEKKAPVFIVSTVNRIDGLPPELLRKGRFDEIFFVGLPNPVERLEILKIHISKKGRDASGFSLSGCVEASESFSGAELEEAVISGMYRAFYEDRELTAGDIQYAIERTRPLAVSRRSELEEMSTWAKDNAIMASAAFASPVAEVKVKTAGGRSLELS